MSGDFGSNPATTAAWYQGSPDGSLELRRIAGGVGAGRWLLAFLLVGTWAIAWKRSDQTERVLEFVTRWPALLGIAVGLVWWTFFTPSLLGLAIVALSLAAIFRTRQERTTSATSAAQRN